MKLIVLKWVSLIALILFLALWLIEQGGKSEVISKQADQIIIQNEIYQETKTAIKKKDEYRNFDVDSDIKWLQEHRCSDCLH